MPYIYFTDEQKLRANSVDLERYLLQNGEELIRSGPEKRLKSDKSITIRGSEWFDHAQAVKTGGGPVAFVMYHYGLSYPEAMIRLLGGEQGVVYEASPRKKEPEPKEFALPPAGESMRRVYAYLLKQRFISREVLNTFVSQRLIYESCEKSKDNTKEYHNAVFVGFDEHGVPRHAHKRGVYTHGKSYRGNVSGCDPRYSFHWTGSSDRLYEVPEKAQRPVAYADKQELEEAIIRRHYAYSIEDEENQVDQGAAAAGGLSQGMRPEANRRKPALRP